MGYSLRIKCAPSKLFSLRIFSFEKWVLKVWLLFAKGFVMKGSKCFRFIIINAIFVIIIIIFCLFFFCWGNSFLKTEAGVLMFTLIKANRYIDPWKQCRRTYDDSSFEGVHRFSLIRQILELTWSCFSFRTKVLRYLCVRILGVYVNAIFGSLCKLSVSCLNIFEPRREKMPFRLSVESIFQ